MALALALASSLLDAPQAFKDRSSLVGFPSLRSGPAMFPILAKNEALRGLSPDFTGAFRLPPVSALYDARPLAFNPPAGFLPSTLCHAGDLVGTLLPCFGKTLASRLALGRRLAAGARSEFLGSHQITFLGRPRLRIIGTNAMSSRIASGSCGIGSPSSSSLTYPSCPSMLAMSCGRVKVTVFPL